MARRTLDDLRSDAAAIGQAGIDAADGSLLVQRASVRDGSRVWFHPREAYNLDAFERVLVVGAGKAAGPMAQGIEAVLGDRLAGGVVAVPAGTPRADLPPSLDVVEAEHPLPGDGSLRAAEAVAATARSATDKDLLIVLVSGGASSMMAAPEDGLELEDLRLAWDALLRAGLAIGEVNTVRKHLITLGGGKLARLASRAAIVTLVLSDVPGNRIESVGSGPTAPDRSTFEDVEQVLSKAGALRGASPRLRSFVERGLSREHPESPKPGDPEFQRVFHRLVGSNETAVAGALLEALRRGYADGGDFRTKSPAPPAAMEAGAVGHAIGVYAAYLSETSRLGYRDALPAAVVGGGEAPAAVRPSGGWGGRLSEFALIASRAIAGCEGVVVAGFATDGRDGAWDGAGAIADGGTIARARRAGVEAEGVLDSSDTGRAFEAAGGKVPARATRTNVADLYVCLIDAA